jgi:hypothetical protein
MKIKMFVKPDELISFLQKRSKYLFDELTNRPNLVEIEIDSEEYVVGKRPFCNTIQIHHKC